MNKKQNTQTLLRGLLSFALFAGMLNFVSATCTITGGAIGSDQAGCAPYDPALLTNVTSVTSPYGGPFKYIWLKTTTDPASSGFNQNTMASTISGATASTYDPGSISVTTWYRRCARRDASICPNYDGESNWVKVTVNAAPATPTFTVGQPGCGQSTGSLTITNLPSGASSKVDGGAFTAGKTSYTGIASGPHTVTFSKNGCESSASFTVNAGGSVSASISGTTAITAGQSTTLTATGGNSYVWSTGATTASISPSPATTTTYSVTATGSNGCTGTASTTVTVTPASNPCSAVTITPGAGNIVVTGYTSPVVAIQVFNSSWAQVYNQQTTSSTTTIPGLAVGTYYVKVDQYSASWQFICTKDGYFTVTSGGNTSVLTLSQPANITVTAPSGQNSMVVNYPAPTASTTCAGGATTVTQTSGLASGSAFPVGTSTVTYQATDNCGNVKTVSFTVTVNPGQATSVLTLSQPSDITVTAGAGQTTAVVTFPAPTASTTCPGGATTVTQILGPVSGSAFPLGQTMVKYQATDNCGNVKTVTFVVTVNPNNGGGGTPDCNAITITPGSGNIVIGGLSAPVIMVQVFNASWAQVFNETYTNNPGTVTIPALANGVYYVKVNFLNASWAAICAKDGYYTVGTTNPPDPGTCTLTLGFIESNKICNNNGTPNNPADDTWTVDFTAKVLANPNGLPTWGWQTTIGNTAVLGMYDMVKNLGPFLISAGNLTFTYTDDDNPTCSKTVTITPPASCSNGGPTPVLTMNCGNNITVTAASGQNSAVVTFSAPTASTTCAGGATNVTQIAGPTSGSAFPVGTTVVTYQATDNCGNVKTCSFNVTVNPGQTTGPDCNLINISTGSGSITVSGLNAPIIMLQIFNGSWASVFNQTYTTNPGTVTIPSLPAGTYYVKVNFLNASWVAICAKDGYFTVTGTTPPTGVLTFNCNNDITVTAATGQNSAVVNYATPTATSTCTTGSVSVTKTSGLNSGSAFPVGTSTVCYQATDGCGNVKTCCFNVTVNPGAAAVLTFNCNNNITVSAAVGATSAVVTYSAPTATSTCTTGSVSVTKTSGLNSGSAFPVGTSTVCYQATDGCGNVKTCCFNVTVNPTADPCATDNVPPTINGCPGNQTLTVAAKYTATNTNKCGTTGTYGMWLAFADANLQNFNISNAMFTENADGSSNLTGVATSQGNSNLKFNINVTWTGRVTAPPSGSPKSLDCTDQVSSYGSNIRFYTGMSGTLVGSGSACTGITFTLTRRGPAFQVGTGANLRQNVLGASGWYTMTKSGSNSGCPAVSEGDFNFNMTSTPNTAVATWNAPSASDNCGTPTLTSNYNSGATFPVGTTNVSYTATDAKNNKSTCNFTITVNQVNPGGGNPGSGSPVDPAKCYYIVNKASGKVIDSEDRDGVNGTFLNQWGIDNTSSEKWKFQDAGNGYFYIVSQNSGAFGKVIDIAGGSTADGAKADVVTANGQDCTKFCFQDAGSGYYYLVAKHSGKAIKLVSSPGTNGTQIFQQPISSSNEHQKWSLQEISCTGALTAPSNTLTFNAFRKGLNSELKWINNTGDKNEFFDIERSLDGDNFTKIGRVDGKGGNAGDQLYFQSFDRNPAVGDNIYRLKMVWKDGTVSYSNEQTVRFETLPALGIYPNPAVDELYVDLSQFVGEKVELNIVNNLGVQVLNKTIDKAEDVALRLDLGNLHSGSYRLIIQSENNRPEVRQVIVEKF